MDKSDTSLILKSIKSDELAAILEIMRVPILKLSEINISKNNFNIWKKAGYLDSMFGTDGDNHGWNKFSLTQLIILSIVDMLWERKMNKDIKDCVDGFMDSTQLDEWITEILEDENQTYLKALNGKNLDLITYIVTQKKENPNLPAISSIEALAIASLRIDRPYSLLIFDDGQIQFFSTSILSDYMGFKFDINMLNKTFLNIGFSSLVKKILTENVDDMKNNSFLKRGSNLIKKYTVNGYDIKKLTDPSHNQSNIEVEEQNIYDRSIKGSTPPKIEEIVKEISNQDIVIKIRNGKKTNIKRFIINKKQ